MKRPEGTSQRLIDILQEPHGPRRGLDDLLCRAGFSKEALAGVEENLANYVLDFAGKLPRRVSTGEMSEFRQHLIKYLAQLKEGFLTIRDATAVFLASGLPVQAFFDGMK